MWVSLPDLNVMVDGSAPEILYIENIQFNSGLLRPELSHKSRQGQKVRTGH